MLAGPPGRGVAGRHLPPRGAVSPLSLDGDEGPTRLRSRVPVDAHLVDRAGGLHAGVLLTWSTPSALPQWLGRTARWTSPLRWRFGPVAGAMSPAALDAVVLRKGRTSVVTQISVTDEGDDGAAWHRASDLCRSGRESSDPNFGRPVPTTPHGAAPIGPVPLVDLRGEAGVGSGHPPRDRRPPPEYVSILHGAPLPCCPTWPRSERSNRPMARHRGTVFPIWCSTIWRGSRRPGQARCTVMGARPDARVRVAMYDTACTTAWSLWHRSPCGRLTPTPNCS